LKASAVVVEAFQAHSGSPGVPVPVAAAERFPIVFHSVLIMPRACVLDAVAHEVADVQGGPVEVRQDAAPIVHSWADEELIARTGKRHDLVCEAPLVGRKAHVSMIVSLGIWSSLSGCWRMMVAHIIIPLPVLVLSRSWSADVPHVNRRRRRSSRPGPSKARCPVRPFVATDVEPRERQERPVLPNNVVQELIRLSLSRRKDVGRFPAGGELGMSEDSPEMRRTTAGCPGCPSPAVWRSSPARRARAVSREPSLGPMVGCFRKRTGTPCNR